MQDTELGQHLEAWHQKDDSMQRSLGDQGVGDLQKKIADGAHPRKLLSRSFIRHHAAAHAHTHRGMI